MLGFHLLFLCVLSLCLSSARANDFSIPSNWESSFTASRDDRINVARGAMNQIFTNISDDSTSINSMDMWQVGPLLSNIAMAELAMGSTVWKDDIARVLAGRAKTTTGFGVDLPAVNDPILAWGLACIYAYRAYGDQSLLALAEQGWANASIYYVTEIEAAAGTHPERDGQLSSTCKGHTTAGAVFYSRDRKNPTVLPSVVGQFAALSAHLSEETSNTTYLQAATLSANFFHNMLSDSNSGAVYHSITLNDCSVDQSQHAEDAGTAMHAWSVIADVTKDDQWREAALKVLASSARASWVGGDGVAHAPAGSDPTDPNAQVTKGQYIASLYEPWIRNNNNASVSNFISALVATQYNALRTRASKDGSNYYNANWNGPGIDYWTQGGVMASTPVLAVALGPGPNSTASSSSPPTNPTNANQGDEPPNPTHHTPIAAIVGGIVGGLVFIALLLLAILLWRRNTARRSELRGRHKEDILGAELEKSPVIMNTSRPVVPQRPMMDPSRSSEVHDTSNVPVADIVEMVYKRLQEERPPYEEATATTSSSPPVPSSEAPYHQSSSARDTRPLPVSATPGLPPYTPRDQVPAKRTDKTVFQKS